MRKGPLLAFPDADEFRTFHGTDIYARHWAESRNGAIATAHRAQFNGMCGVCEKQVRFQLTEQETFALLNDDVEPNWRETLRCPRCKLIARVRVAAQVLREHVAENMRFRVYASEAVTELSSWLKTRYRFVGSEFLETEPLGSRVWVGAHRVRNEDLTRLRFQAAVFDAIISLEVLEHIPDYGTALREFCRVTRPGGVVIISAPFGLWDYEHTPRARVRPDGSIEHLLPPEYHGDPTGRDGGVLCFHHFGWKLLDELREVGFASTELVLGYSVEYGYCDWGNFVVVARK